MEKEDSVPDARSLISQTEKEKAIVSLNAKLESLDRERVLAKRAATAESFILCFISTWSSYFKADSKKLRDMSERELVVLADMLASKAKPWAALQTLFFFVSLPTVIIPIWFSHKYWTGCSCPGGYNSCEYLYHYLLFRKQFGPEYFPVDLLRQRL